MKKRIGNDIHFTWTVKRKNGELLTPEDFTGKECVVELIDDYHRRCVIDNVVFGEGTVSWTFWGKDQRATGAYTAVLSENRGAEGMVTIDTVKAVVLVSHSYQEEDDDAEGVIETESVELESEISTGGGTPVDAYTKAQTDALLAEKQNVVEDLDTIRSGADAGATAYQKPQTGIPSTDMSSAVQTSLVKADTALQTETDPTVPAWAKAQNKPTYTAQEVGALPDSTTIPSALSDLTDDATHRTVTDTEKTVWNNKSDFSGSYNDLSDKPTIPDAQIQSDWNQSDNTQKDYIKNKPTIPAAQVQSDWNESDTSNKAYINNKPTIPDISNCIQKSSTPGLVKNDGSIDTNTYLTQHQDISGKADKVSSATNGNFAALDSNGNLVDSGHKHGDYLTSHQDLSNYVQKSNTQGLLKNDGTVDTTQYLSQHQDITGKEDITPIEAVTSGTTAITAQVNKYYEVAGTVSSLTVTLPTPTVDTEVTMVVVHLTVGASPTVVVTSSATVAYSAAYSVIANKEYELSCLYNGSKWIVSSMEVAV